MSEQVLDSFEEGDFSGVVILSPNGTIMSRCKRHKTGCVQTLGHSSEEQAKKFIRWWVQRPD